MEIKISLLYAMSFVPKNKKMHIKGRPQHTFLYISEGEYHYRYNRESFIAKKGDLVYIPKGAVYVFEILSEPTYCHQVEFAMESDSFPILNCPQIIDGADDAENTIKEIVMNYDVNNQKNYLLALGKLYSLCSHIPVEEETVSASSNKIKPAAEYIESHYSEKIDIEFLANLCFMSQSQLRRYFKEKYKMSPVTYKNRYRIEKAKSMLLYDVANVSEIAENLGFDSVYSFSKMFKTYAGITPSQFAKNKNLT